MCAEKLLILVGCPWLFNTSELCYVRSVDRIKLLVSLTSVAEGALVGGRLAVPGGDNV